MTGKLTQLRGYVSMRQDSLFFIAAIVSYCEAAYYAACVWSSDGDTMWTGK